MFNKNKIQLRVGFVGYKIKSIYDPFQQRLALQKKVNQLEVGSLNLNVRQQKENSSTYSVVRALTCKIIMAHQWAPDRNIT